MSYIRLHLFFESFLIMFFPNLTLSFEGNVRYMKYECDRGKAKLVLRYIDILSLLKTVSGTFNTVAILQGLAQWSGALQLLRFLRLARCNCLETVCRVGSNHTAEVIERVMSTHSVSKLTLCSHSSSFETLGFWTLGTCTDVSSLELGSPEPSAENRCAARMLRWVKLQRVNEVFQELLHLGTLQSSCSRERTTQKFSQVEESLELQ